MAKFHAVSLTYKRDLFATLSSQCAAAKASRGADEVVMEGEDERTPQGRRGLFARFPFLGLRRQATLAHLVENRERFLDMYSKLLRCFPEEEHLGDIFDYVRLSADDLLLLGEDVTSDDYEDSPLDAITLGVVDTRSFLFRYRAGAEDEDGENKENGAGGRKKKSSKLQRSQSERVKVTKTRGSSTPPSPGVEHSGKTVTRQQSGNRGTKAAPTSPGMPANAKCPKLESSGSGAGHNSKVAAAAAAVRHRTAGGAASNKFLQNVIGKSKDDEAVPVLTGVKRGAAGAKALKDRDPNAPPRAAALVTAKYVTYGRVTRDLAVLVWTAAPTLVRRHYLIKLVECYVETLGITLGQLGVDTDTFGLKYQAVVEDFQKQILYGFLMGVLLAMAATDPEEVDALFLVRKI